MAVPGPGHQQSSSHHNVLFYLPQQQHHQHVNGSSLNGGDVYRGSHQQSYHGGSLNHLPYVQTSHNRYRPDTTLVQNKTLHCFPSDNPYCSDRETLTGTYWSHQQHQQIQQVQQHHHQVSHHQSYQQQQQQQYSYQWSHQQQQHDYHQVKGSWVQDGSGMKASPACWQQQHQQLQLQTHQQVPHHQQQQSQMLPGMMNPNSCSMGYAPGMYNQQQQQPFQQQPQQFHQQQQPQQQQFANYRQSNLVATVTVQSAGASAAGSRTPSRCDSVRSEACESNCSSGEDHHQQVMTAQQYGYQQNYYVQQQQPFQQQIQTVQQHHQPELQEPGAPQCFWPSHYEVQQEEEDPQQSQEPDYFRQDQQQEQAVVGSSSSSSCYWPRNPSPPEETQQSQEEEEEQQDESIQEDEEFSSCPVESVSLHQPDEDEAVPCSTSDGPEEEPMVQSTSSSSPATTSSTTGIAPPTPPAEEEEPSPPPLTVPVPSTEIPPASVAIPSGWTRDVSAGSVTYISPSGSRLTSLTDVASYVQRDGTCKCGLPCPLQLQRVFNFDPAVLCNAATSLDDEGTRTCSHRAPLDATRTTETTTPTTQPADLKEEEPKEPLGEQPPVVLKPASKRKKTPSGNGGHKPGKVAKILPAVSPAAGTAVQQQQQGPHRRSPCPNVDVRQIPLEHNRPPAAGSLLPQARPVGAPSFFEDPSAYLAQQTVLLQSSLNSSQTVQSSPSPPPAPTATQQPAAPEPTVSDEAGEELLGDLLDCIPDSMEEVLDRQKDVAAAAEAAAQAEKAANLIKQAAAAVIQRQQEAAAAAAAAAASAASVAAAAATAASTPTAPVAPQPKPAAVSGHPPERTSAPRSSTKPPPLAIRPATPATAARARAIRPAETSPSSAKGPKSKSPRRNGGSSAHHPHHHGHHQVPIQIQSNAPKVLQPAQPHHQHPAAAAAQQFWPAISTTASLGPLRTTSFPFTYHSTVGPAAGTPIFSTAALRPGNLPMTFLTSTAAHPTGQPQFNAQSLPVLTTRPALAPSGQLVHVLTAPGPILAAAEPSTTAVPILTVGPMNPGTGNNGNNNGNAASHNSNGSGRGLTRTGKKRKSTPQTVASILQQGAQLTAMTQHHPTTTTLTLSQDQSQTSQLVYNVQNYQQIQPQPQPTATIQTLALMPDGKTYVVVNSTPAQTAVAQSAPQPQSAQQNATAGHWLLSPRPQTGLNLAPAGQPMQPVNVTNISGLINGFSPATTFVLGGTGGPQVLQLQDGTLLQTTGTDQSNQLLTTNYGGLFIRCPPAQHPSPAQIFSPAAAVRTLQPVPVPIAPGRSPGRSPDSSSADHLAPSVVTSTAELVACGEATPPQQPVRAAHPSPVVQSSQIDSCVQEVDDSKAVTKPGEHNNNSVQQQWLKPGTPTAASSISGAPAGTTTTTTMVAQIVATR